MKKIMIVEDDKSVQEELMELLSNSGFEVSALNDFKNSKERILSQAPDLVLLDINIPYINGEILLKEIRKTSNVPIIMVTSQCSEVDEVLSMSYGADDYIVKPYNPTLLLLRINAVFNRMENSGTILVYEKLNINVKKGIIKRDEIEIILTKNEMIIFTHLLSKRNQIVTRDDLMTDLWNNDEYINDNALSVNISRLRGKLKDVEYENVIETRKGQGYVLI